MRVVIVGGDAAGMSAASQIRRRKPEVEVIVLEQGYDVSYGQCGMPFNIADPERDINDVVVMTADTFINKRKIDLRLGHRLKSILPRQNTLIVETKEGSYQLKYDKLIAATGASPIKPPIPGIESEKVLYFHTLETARKLKSILADTPKASFTVVGAGLVGLEVSEALVKRGMNVTLIEKLPVPFPFLGKSVSEKIEAEIKNNGITSYFGQSLVSIEEKDSQLELTLGNHNKINTDYVIMTVGVKPNSQIFLDAEVKAGPQNTIATDEYLYTSNPDILAAGDCADAFHTVSGKRVYVPLALRANRAGKTAGANAVGFRIKVPSINGTAGIRFFNLETAWTGLSEESAAEAGFEPVIQEITANSKAHSFPGGGKLLVRLIADKTSGRFLGGVVCGPVDSTALRIDVLSAALHHKAEVSDIADYDLVYSPPFGPTWSPVLVAASQLLKKLQPKVK